MRPVLEDGSVAAVDNQLVRMLCHSRVQIVLNHQHDGSSLTTLVRIVIDGASKHLIAGTIAVHIDASIALQLFGKLRCELCVQVFWEIAQGVAQRQPLLLGRQYVLPLRSVVDLCIIGFSFRQIVRNAKSYL